MFDLVDNIGSVDFVTLTDNSKSKTEWRNELVAFGLKHNDRFFSIHGGIAPIYASLADAKYESRFGTSPRVSVAKSAEDAPIFNHVCEHFGIRVVKNFGLVINGFDFDDDRTAQEIGSFIVGFEQSYRKLKAMTKLEKNEDGDYDFKTTKLVSPESNNLESGTNAMFNKASEPTILEQFSDLEV